MINIRRRSENLKKSYILDTSALITYFSDEPGSEEVNTVIMADNSVNISEISIMEIYYIFIRKADENKAREVVRKIEELGIISIEISRTILFNGARIKAQHPLSLADAIIAATAIELQAQLIHKDPEFKPLTNRIKLVSLV